MTVSDSGRIQQDDGAERAAERPSGDWQCRYQSLITSAEEAITRVRPGQRVFMGTACGQPQALVSALLSQAAKLDDVEIIHLLTLGEPAFAHAELVKHFRVNSFFVADSFGAEMRQGVGNYTPIFLSDIPRLFRSGRIPIDVALIQVTPPNEHEMCSLGVSVDVTKSAAENAGLVVAEVNPHMPWTMGDSLLSVHDLDVLVPSNAPLLELNLPEPTQIARRIAEYISALIPNGSTVELGTDPISLAVLESLKDKRDLGVHAVVLSDAIVDLLDAGAITGRRKTLDCGKIVATSCMGTRRLFDYIDKNPAFGIYPAEYVSDPRLISQQHNMVAISTALQIDLTGQSCANLPGDRLFSGLAAHMDFIHGAARAPAGTSVVALESTRDRGSASRIVAHLARAANVTATCCEVHYVVTEFGVAYLHGKSLQERALALISIAHPNFRAALLAEAIRDGYISSDLATIEGKVFVAPQELRTSLLLDDGTKISFRPMHPTDERQVRDLLHSLSPKSFHHRFMSNMTRIPQKQIQDFVYIDYRSEMAIVGTVPEAHGEEIIAIGRYYLTPPANRAEVAMIVRDQWQNRGIGTFLMNFLIGIAKRSGIRGFRAEVLRDNKPTLAMVYKSQCKVRSRLEDDVYAFELDFL